MNQVFWHLPHSNAWRKWRLFSLVPADFIFECSEGEEGNIGVDGTWDPLYKPGSGTPTILSTDWAEDIEWAILYSCNVFSEVWKNEYTEYWDDALIGRDDGKNCHGILGSSQLLQTVAASHMAKECGESIFRSPYAFPPQIMRSFYGKNVVSP